MADTTKSYTESFDVLVALVTHLASTQLQSRTAPHMARDLGFDSQNVRTVLDRFPGLFRKSRRTDKDGEPYYTVHLRYARRQLQGEHDTEEAENEPLSSDELSSLFQLITQMVAHESERSNLLIEQQSQNERLATEFRHSNRALFWTSVVTIIAASIAAIAAIYTASIKLPPKAAASHGISCFFSALNFATLDREHHNNRSY